MSDLPRIPALDRAMIRAIPALRRIVIAAIETLQDGISTDEAERAIEARSAAPLLESAGWARFEAALATAFSPGGPLDRMAEAIISDSMNEQVLKGVQLDLQPVRERAARWLEVEGAEQVTRISRETKEAIRELVAKASRSPYSIEEAARQMLKVKGFGLNRPLQRRYLRYTADLTERWQAGELTRRQVHHLARIRMTRLRRERAKLIARTEANNGGNAARQILWSDAARQGGISAAEYVRRWVTRNIGVCPRCEALRDKFAPIDGEFVSDPVRSGRYAGQIIRIMNPTVHPVCFCGVRLERRRSLR